MDCRGKRILIVGASLLQVPQILRAKELGFYVGVADMNPNAVGIPYADEFFCVSTTDQEGIYEVAKDFRADGITTVATDMPVRSIAYASEKLGLNSVSIDTARKTTDKGEMIKAFEEHHVAHPWYYILQNMDDLIKVKTKILYPCISKPTDNSGSRGVMLIRSEAELQKAVAYSSSCGRNGQVIIEEYLTGQEISVEAFALKGECHVLAITDKITTGAPHFVELGHTQPAQLDSEVQLAVVDLAEAAMKAVGIENGPAHLEMMITEAGPIMIEMGARMGGDFITTDLVPLSTGIDMLGATILVSCGIMPDIEQKCYRGSAIRYFQTKEGTIKRIAGVEEAKGILGVHRIELFKGIGDVVSEVENSADRLGCVIAYGDNCVDAIECCEKVLHTIEVEI